MGKQGRAGAAFPARAEARGRALRARVCACEGVARWVRGDGVEGVYALWWAGWGGVGWWGREVRRQGRGGMQSAWVGCEDWMVEEERRGMDLRALVVTRCSTCTHGYKAQWPEQLTADQHVPGSDHLWIGMLALQKQRI